MALQSLWGTSHVNCKITLNNAKTNFRVGKTGGCRINLESWQRCMCIAGHPCRHFCIVMQFPPPPPTNSCSHSNHIPFQIWANHSYFLELFRAKLFTFFARCDSSFLWINWKGIMGLKCEQPFAGEEQLGVVHIFLGVVNEQLVSSFCWKILITGWKLSEQKRLRLSTLLHCQLLHHFDTLQFCCWDPDRAKFWLKMWHWNSKIRYVKWWQTTDRWVEAAKATIIRKITYTRVNTKRDMASSLIHEMKGSDI